MQGALPLASPGLNPRGTGSPCRCGTLRGACFVCRLPTLPLPSFLPPIPPAPFPGGEGGVLRLFYARGSAPCIPGAEPARHWGRGRTTHPAGVCLRNLQLGAKPTEPPFYWQCRQPRRGGTGGEELRRLRWSSPPGQGKQVPPGFKHPLPLRTPQRQGQQAPPGAEGAPPIPPSDACKNRKIMVKPSPE